MVERDVVLAQLADAIERTRAGAGSCMVVEGARGTGRTSVLKAVTEQASRSGLTVLQAAGTSLEAELAWGVAARLLRPAHLRWPSGVPGAPASSPNDLAAICRTRMVATGAEAPTGTSSDEAALAHGLSIAIQRFSRTAHASGGGVLIAVDDAHWADGQSLRLLAQLAQHARRARRVPVCLVLATAAGAPLADSRAAAALSSASDRLRTTELSDSGVADVVSRHIPGADPTLTSACAAVTGGNPALLHDLLDGLDGAAPPTDAAALLETIPDGVRESVAERLSELTAEHRRIVQSVAVLGEEATVSQVAALADADADVVLTAAGTLARTGLLAPRLPLAVVPPLVAAAVRDSLAPFDLSRAHLQAARILRAEQADTAAIAEHLLGAPASEDRDMIGPLRDTARRAAEENDHERAARLLDRALAERPDDGLRLGLMTDLAWVQAGTDELTEPGRLRALHRTDLPAIPRGGLALAMGRALYAHRRPAEAIPILAIGTGLLEGRDAELHAEALAASVICASLIDDLVPNALAGRRALLQVPPDRLAASARAAVAHTVIRDVLSGAPRTRVRELAELAWGEGRLLESGPFLGLGASLLCVALVLADELERASEILEAVHAAPRTPWIAAADSALRCARAWIDFLRGDVTHGGGGAIEALGAAQAPDHLTTVTARALSAACGVEAGRVEAAARVLADQPPSVDSLGRVVWLVVRSQVRLADHRPQDALRDALEAGQALRSAGAEAASALVGWRSAAALALLSLDDRERAESLVREELRQAVELGNQRAMTGALRTLGLALGGDGLAALERAVEVGDMGAPRLVHVKALVELGAALRRANRRVEARVPLRRALDLSNRGGARLLERRARAELTAAGARPRRAATTGVDSLTASQSRVAELAADGLTTRQIADALFVTPKTVEFHLRHAYRKLDVKSRADLSQALQRA